jgi:hypothetical protein
MNTYLQGVTMTTFKFTVLFKFAFLMVILTGCSNNDDNAKPIYGEESGLPVNCRAYVQAAIDGYRSHQYSADDAFNGLERNCGMYGAIWKDNREKK